MINYPHSCLYCDHFAWWDGDYCCTNKMKILSYTEKNTHKAITPNIITEINNCDSFSTEYQTDKHRKTTIEAWNRHNYE